MDKNGYYYTDMTIKENAKPIDNINKFAWDDDDYVIEQKFHEYTDEELSGIDDSSIPKFEKIQAEQDDAICFLYEMLIGGQSGK